MKTEQETFDEVYRGAASQGFERSVQGSRPGSVCLYRGPNGLKCNAGHLIPDTLYAVAFERKSVYDSGVVGVLRMLGHGVGTANDLQRLHDGAVNALDHKNRLHGYAKRHGLTIPSV